ncbi:hypothetical protein CMO91_03860 [Candidatus Woesearchaeota archaeon]|nr:hypothetical protein [Candidatus Woesearchaeota archaeon]
MKHVIWGIDPGTTVGYAVLDIQGKPLYQGQTKHLDVDGLVAKLRAYGKPLLIGTDKAKVPGFIQQIAAKTGAKVVRPSEDLSLTKKRSMVGAKSHATDALAAAMVAYNNMGPLLRRIIRFAQDQHVQDRLGAMLELVIKRGVSRTAALETVQDREIVAPVIHRAPTKQDYVKLLGKLAKEKQEKTRLAYDLEEAVKELREAQRKTKPAQRVIMKQPASQKLRKEVTKLRQKNALLAKLAQQNKLVVPIIKNLSTHEVQKVVDKDIIMVEEPSQHSEQGLSLVQDKLVIVQRPWKKSNLTMVHGKKIRMQVIDNLAFVDKNSLRKALEGNTLLERIITEYRESRA